MAVFGRIFIMSADRDKIPETIAHPKPCSPKPAAACSTAAPNAWNSHERPEHIPRLEDGSVDELAMSLRASSSNDATGPAKRNELGVIVEPINRTAPEEQATSTPSGFAEKGRSRPHRQVRGKALKTEGGITRKIVPSRKHSATQRGVEPAGRANGSVGATVAGSLIRDAPHVTVVTPQELEPPPPPPPEEEEERLTPEEVFRRKKRQELFERDHSFESEIARERLVRQGGAIWQWTAPEESSILTPLLMLATCFAAELIPRAIQFVVLNFLSNGFLSWEQWLERKQSEHAARMSLERMTCWMGSRLTDGSYCLGWLSHIYPSLTQLASVLARFGVSTGGATLISVTVLFLMWCLRYQILHTLMGAARGFHWWLTQWYNILVPVATQMLIGRVWLTLRRKLVFLSGPVNRLLQPNGAAGGITTSTMFTLVALLTYYTAQILVLQVFHNLFVPVKPMPQPTYVDYLADNLSMAVSYISYLSPYILAGTGFILRNLKYVRTLELIVGMSWLALKATRLSYHKLIVGVGFTEDVVVEDLRNYTERLRDIAHSPLYCTLTVYEGSVLTAWLKYYLGLKKKIRVPLAVLFEALGSKFDIPALDSLNAYERLLSIGRISAAYNLDASRVDDDWQRNVVVMAWKIISMRRLIANHASKDFLAPGLGFTKLTSAGSSTDTVVAEKSTTSSLKKSTLRFASSLLIVLPILLSAVPLLWTPASALLRPLFHALI